MQGFSRHDASARRTKRVSRRWISSAPTASFSAKTSPARIDSTIAVVPPSSRISGSGWYDWLVGLTNRIVPPPGTDGTRLANSARLATSTPGAGAADELVRRDEDGVLPGQPGVLSRGQVAPNPISRTPFRAPSAPGGPRRARTPPSGSRDRRRSARRPGYPPRSRPPGPVAQPRIPPAPRTGLPLRVRSRRQGCRSAGWRRGRGRPPWPRPRWRAGTSGSSSGGAHPAEGIQPSAFLPMRSSILGAGRADPDADVVCRRRPVRSPCRR